MKIKKLLTPLLLILLLASMVVFGAPQPMGPYFDDTYLEYGNDGLNVKTATVTDGDTTHVPTCDNVYDFCETTQDYMQDLVDDSSPQLGGNLDANDHAILENVTTVTTTHTLTVAEAGVVLVSASSDYTITLPTAVGNTGLTYKFKKTDANYNCITLDGDGTETINYKNADGVPKETYARLNTYCAEVTLVSDGSNWQVYDEALGQVPECWVYLSTDQLNLLTGKVLVIEFDSTVEDIGSNFCATTWITGSATETSAGHLVDTTNNQFTSTMVGKRIKNTTDTTYAYITAYNSTSDLTVSPDIFVSGEEYEIKNAKYITPVSGRYSIFANLAWDTGLEDGKVYGDGIYKNHSSILWGNQYSAGTAGFGQNLTFTFSASKNDYIELVAISRTSTDTSDLAKGSNQTYMKIRLVSKD